MKFTTTTEVKKWLRGLPLLKRELELRAVFYAELMQMSRKMVESGQRHENHYLMKTQEMHQRLRQMTEDTDRLLKMLTPEESAVLTARYIKGVLWDGIEFYVHYSRRNAIRIHNKALKKLVGQEVGADVYEPEV